MNFIDRITATIAPRWTLNRVRARSALGVYKRHYEAAQPGRRTSGWARNRGDANAVAGAALVELRMHARDLVRNVGWARKAQRVIANHVTGGWGITPRPGGTAGPAAAAAWKEWAESTRCDVAERLTFSAIQHLGMRTIADSGEVLIRRRVGGGGRVPLQLQVLEPDYIDTAKDLDVSQAGGPIIQGVEFDGQGRRAAYWLFRTHPGDSRRASAVSERVPAADVLHVFYPERPGQVRGISWFGAAIVPIKGLDEYEDAELMRQKIAACFAAFVTDPEGVATPISATEDNPEAGGPELESFEPGGIFYLPPGKTVTMASPPAVVEGTFSQRHLRKVAAALGVAVEDLTGDYSQVNFSSARMSRLSHWAHVRDWQWNMLIPLLCQGVWAWFLEAAQLAGVLPPGEIPVEWTAPPMPMIEPDKEGLAYVRNVRGGIMTPSDVVLEQGGDPATHWQRYAEDLATLDRLGIKLDSDVRAVSQAGLTQQRVGASGQDSSEPE